MAGPLLSGRTIMSDMKQNNMQKPEKSEICMLFEMFLLFFPSEEVKEKARDPNCQNSLLV